MTYNVFGGTLNLAHFNSTLVVNLPAKTCLKNIAFSFGENNFDCICACESILLFRRI